MPFFVSFDVPRAADNQFLFPQRCWIHIISKIWCQAKKREKDLLF